MGLKDRLRKLENRPAAKECPECRLPPGDPGYIVYDADGGQSREQEFCSACGEPKFFIIRVAYDDEGEATASETTVDLSWP